ncbi:MAG: N-acetyl-gamma-glutamyl-phosphate reductase [Planctomycetes bacterium]|nr:N-acetyl-gamma-glutamyl-phosphate reductase [Planctomycetota bacterium]
MSSIDGAEPRPSVGVFGASGITGRELCRLLRDHPRFEVAFATSREHSSLAEVDPAAPDLALSHPDAVDPGGVDVVCLCLPHGRSAAVAARCLAAGARVVDLSGDLRLRSAATHASTYGSPRDEAVAAQAVYGLTEVARAQLPTAQLVANPGCYPTCVALALLPLAEAGRLRGPLVVHAASGVSGAGASPTPTTHFCSVNEDVRPYKVGRAHRHVPEMEQALGDSAPGPAPVVVFNPHLVPLERGMLATIVVHGAGLGADEALELYRARYADEAFVRVGSDPARIRAAARTNDAVVGVSPVEGLDALVVTCAIDNVLKGAAGQALQNLNAMFDLPESLGLPSLSSKAALAGACA